MKLNLRDPRHSLALAGLGLFAIELLVCWLYRGPTPIPDEPIHSQDFSAERAVSIHEELFPPKPHPAGSVENLIVRDRLVELLRNLGWTVEMQTAVVESDAKVMLHNVLATRPELAQFKTRPLVLATHYDSCRTGPGASDAGGCVAAVIEAARGVIDTDTTFGTSIQRPIYLLFTDGEELGLLGAQQFVKRHSLSARKPIVLNFDARGTSGPVLMYETHAGNRAAVAAWANELARPRITGSLFTSVYRTLPNGSDFTVFRDAGWQGFNFAIIGGVHRYHLPDDTLVNLDRRSLQHFGEHALKLARRIATTQTELPDDSDDALFFDLLGQFVISFPLSWCLPLSLLVFTAVVATNWRRALLSDGVNSFLRVGLSILAVACVSPVMGWFLSRLARDTGLLPRSFVWYGAALVVALWFVSAALSLGIGRWLLRRSAPDSVWSGLWLWWTLAGISVATIAPEFSHLLFIPGCLAAGLSATRWRTVTRVLVVAAGGGLLLIPVLHLLSIALGPSAGTLLCPAFALTLLPLFPLLADHLSGMALATGVVPSSVANGKPAASAVPLN